MLKEILLDMYTYVFDLNEDYGQVIDHFWKLDLQLTDYETEILEILFAIKNKG